MEISLVQYISSDISEKSNFIKHFSDRIESAFLYQKYGNDLESIIIGVICVSTSLEVFFKPRKPKYTKEKKNVVSEGFNYEIEKILEYDIKLDFETFKNASESEAKKILAKEILQSLSVLDSMKKKIKDFDSEKFKSDLECYFKENGLI